MTCSIDAKSAVFVENAAPVPLKKKLKNPEIFSTGVATPAIG